MIRTILILLLISVPAFAADKIVIGYTPSENSELVQANGKRLSQIFKQKLGVDTETFMATDYTALIEAMRSGQVQLAWLPPFSFVKAEQIADAVVLLKAKRKGETSLYSAIITRADKGIKTLKDLKGKNMAWVDPASSSGFIIPKAALKVQEGVDADTFFKRQIYAGSHDALVLAVFNGTVDAGATFCNDGKAKDCAWHAYLKNPADLAKIRVLFVSKPIPSDTLATTKKFQREHPDLLKKSIELIQNKNNDKEMKQILWDLYHIEGMVPTNSKEFDVVRNAAKAVGIN